MDTRQKPGGLCKDECGFTLGEVLVTIVIMGNLIGIAVPTWRRVVEGRQVDSATNQLEPDLRLAHTQATNRLVKYQVVLTNGSSGYQVGPVGSLNTRTLPDDVKVSMALSTIEFKPDGSVTGPAETADEIVVSKASPAAAPQHGIRINPATSRVKVD